MEKAFLVEKIENNLIIQFNRPEIRSPLSIFVLENLKRVLDEIAESRSVDKIIFTGQNDVFASGADLREISQVTKETAVEFALRGQNLMNQIASAKPITIAAVNGFCFGGALDLALSCSYRIASASAQFSHPGASLGIMTGWGGTQRLPRLVGEAAALEMFLTAKRLSAREALQIGLIDSISETPLTAALAIPQINRPEF